MTTPTATNRISIAEYRRLLETGKPVRLKRKNPEEDLHRDCVAWATLNTARHPTLRWLVHYPSGGKRPKGEAGRMKALGTKKGYPDLTIPRRSGAFAGLAVELKSPKGPVTPEQREWLAMFEEEGWLTAVCRSIEEFMLVVQTFLAGRPLRDRESVEP